MTAAHPVTEHETSAPEEDREQQPGARPYAILWLAGREVLLFEDECGEFFSA